MEIYDPTQLIHKLEVQYIYRYTKANKQPVLAIILCNPSEDDMAYLRNITKKAETYGVLVDVRTCDEPIDGVLAAQSLRSNSTINGVLILGSFGEKENKAIADNIPMRLDIDCASYDTLGHMIFDSDEESFRSGPCTSIACYEIIKDIYGSNDFSGKKMAILGRSLRVGLPLAEILVQRDATTTVYHSKSYADYFANYDVVTSAVGVPKIWKKESFMRLSGNPEIIIDVGINIDEDGSICGDIDYTGFEDFDGILVSSPGGVGRVTTTVLFSKLFINFGLSNGEII